MPYRIAITGSTGLVGEAVIDFFKSKGHQMTRIIRKDTKIRTDDACIVWDIDAGTIDAQKLEDHHAVIHLAGANIAAQRWSAQYKRLLYSSRVDSTKLLSTTLAALNKKPKVFLSASAVGFYGPHGPTENVDERTPLGSDYLAQICQHWESATEEAKQAGIRVVNMRIGIVLSKEGGALAQMLPIFKCGIGGKIASGKQMMSWIALDEIPPIMLHLIDNDAVQGPVNLVSPNPVSNEEFTKALGRAIKRPTVLPVPSFGIRMMFGEMGETLLLNGVKVLPKQLSDSHYRFKYKDIDSALEASLNATNA